MSKKLSYTFTVSLVIVSCTLTYLIGQYINSRILKTTLSTINSIEDNQMVSSDFKIERLKGYRLIKPIVTAEPSTESAEFYGLKVQLSQYIEALKRDKKIISASLYVLDLNQGIWMSINPDVTYHPGSIMKVATLICYLKSAELYPHLLDKQVINDFPVNQIPIQIFNSKQLEHGKRYTIKELLKYMIAYSDNNATCLLMNNMDVKIFINLFSDLKIPVPSAEYGDYVISVKDFSVLLKVLYNSTYLSTENSELALELLNQCDFKIGMLNELPTNIAVAHKFGEGKDKTSFQLHETGLVYLENSTYLLTIMTQGDNIHNLPPVLSSISKIVYDFVSQMKEIKH